MNTVARISASTIRRAPMFRDRDAIATIILGAAMAYAGFRFAKWGVVHASGRCGRMRARRRARRHGPRRMLGRHRRALSLILCGAYPSASSGGRPWPVCCSSACTRPARYGACGIGACSSYGSFCRCCRHAVARRRVRTLGRSERILGRTSVDIHPLHHRICVAFPLAVALALGRRAPFPPMASTCIVYIELMRGVPLVTVSSWPP